MDLAEYPELPAPGVTHFTALGPTFADLVTRTAITAGRDDTVPLFTAVRLELEENTVTAFATDRYRMGMLSARVLADPASMAGRASAAHLAKVVAMVAKDVTVAVSFGEWLAITSGFRIITLRAVDGQFPKVRAIMPTDLPVTATVNRKALITAAKNVAKAAERNTPVRLSFTQNELVLAAGPLDR